MLVENNNFEKLFSELEKVQKNKNALYSIKPYEKYNALNIKPKGLEKLQSIFKNYKAKSEKEKAYIQYITTCKYYGKDASDIQKYILDLLNS